MTTAVRGNEAHKGQNQERTIMSTRDSVDDTLQRVAMAALAYYPEVQLDEPGYQLAEDVDWCLEPLTALGKEDMARLRDLVGRTITNPSEYRQTLFGAVLGLLPD